MHKTIKLIAVGISFAAAMTARGQGASSTESRIVTPRNFTRAESDKYFTETIRQAGGVNRFRYIRKPASIEQQPVVRMNRDTLYSSAVVDTSKGATITFPKIPANRYASVLVLDNDHYAERVIYQPGTYELPHTTRYMFLAIRVQVLNAGNPDDVAIANRIQDAFKIHAASAQPFPTPRWDVASLDALRKRYNGEFAKYGKYPDDWQGPRGAVNEKTRAYAAAGAWGLFPNRDATYINYNPHLPDTGCYTATYRVPPNKAFWSITLYGADGYMKSDNGVLNKANTRLNPDGTFTAYFGSVQACGDKPNRIDISEGWNFLMRIYRPGASVLDGSYKLPEVRPTTWDRG